MKTPDDTNYNIESDIQEKIDKTQEKTIEDLSNTELQNIPENQKEESDPTTQTNNETEQDIDMKDVEMETPEKNSDVEMESPKRNTNNTEAADVSNSDKSPSLDEAPSETDTSIVTIEDTNETPRKNPKLLKKEGNSSRKKDPEGRQKEKEERERKRVEEKEAREKMKREKLEQKIKERQEKEEQKKKEKQEKEDQKRKEREEKEAQRIKEKEEKEAMKLKEKEEKELQKIKEREEKEEQKRKEKEEKEEQKRKEKEEKELKDKKKMEKSSAAFVNFFVPRKSIGASEPKKTEEVKKFDYFMPFPVKADMRLAPTVRQTITSQQKENLVEHITSQTGESLYLSDIKTKKIGRTPKTWPVDDTNDVIIIDDTELGECVESETTKPVKMRAKFLQFHENRRPAYFGTWRKKSKSVKPRNPLGIDKNVFDYEVDSDDDWEEEEPGESLHGSDDEEKENDSDNYEIDNEFFVPHGYLSDEEAENEENMESTPETQKEKLKILQIEFEEEMKSKTERIKPRLIGCIWDSKLKPKIQDAISSFLEDRMMIITAPIIIKKRENNVKVTTPSRKQLTKELIPDFLRLIHGNTKNQTMLANEFITFLSNEHKNVRVSKSGLIAQLKEFAAWKKCPEEGIMFNKHCWYVNEDVRKQFELNLVLPQKMNPEESIVKKKLSL